MDLFAVKQHLSSKKDGYDLVLTKKSLTYLPDLSSIKQLNHIDLTGNSLKNLDFLANAHSLSWINASRMCVPAYAYILENKLTSIDSLAKLRNLHVFRASHNEIAKVEGL